MKTSTTSCPIRERDLVGKRAPESVCARERSYTGATDDLIPLRERRRAPSIRTWKRAATHPCGGHAMQGSGYGGSRPERIGAGAARAQSASRWARLDKVHTRIPNGCLLMY